MRQSPKTAQKSDEVVSDFRISGQSFIKENCHNSSTGDHIDMKLRPVTKPDKRKKTLSKKFDVIVNFSIFGQFGAIQKPDSRRIVYKTYVFINSKLLISQKMKTELKYL